MLHRTDRWVLIACALTVGIWCINVRFSSILLLYANVLLISGVFSYLLLRADPRHELRRAWLIGLVACIVYAYVDSLLTNLRFGLILHLKTNDWSPFGETPLALILLWGGFITFVLYLYQRLRSLWPHMFPAILLTAGFTLIAGFGLEWLGNAARLWNWNAEAIRSGYLFSIPVFIPISYALASLFAPYVLKYPLVGGLRCGIVLAGMRFGGFTLIYYLNATV